MTEAPVMVITGTRTGIGRSLTLHYLDAGWIVFGASRGPASIEASRYHHFSLDVADENAVKRMFTETRRHFGRLDALSLIHI